MARKIYFEPEIQKLILVLEEKEISHKKGSVNFKIGVLYAKPGQASADEFFRNEHRGEEFNKFLRLLGDSVRLKGRGKFKAGLDVTSNITSEEFRYTVYEGHEIMLHDATENKQQELECFDVPQILSLRDGSKGENEGIKIDNQICIGYKHQFDLINEKNGDTLQLFQTDSNKNVTSVSASEIFKYEKAEPLLPYNYVSHFKKLKERL